MSQQTFTLETGHYYTLLLPFITLRNK